MKFIDIGANLANSQMSSALEILLGNAEKHNVEQIILTTVDSSSFKSNLTLCSQRHPIKLHTTWGLHPHYANTLDSFSKETEEAFANNSIYIKALGEFGLDFNRMKSTESEQIRAMRFFMDCSQETNLPLFLHERDAHDKFCEIYKEYKAENKAVMHCFTGNKIQAKKYLDMGMFIGITGWLCDDRRNLALRDAIKYIPNDRLMIETDSPYLKPKIAPGNSRINEPANIRFVMEKLAEEKQMKFEKLSEIIYNNTIEFFNINTLEKKFKI